jgi:hypothetical protein
MRPSPAEARQNREEAAAALAALGRELVGGGLRWLATFFTIGGVVLLAGTYTGMLPAETFWPVRTQGTTATVLIVLLFAFWAVIAVANWRSHLKRRRD